MVRGKGWMALALCGVLSLTAIGCRDRNDTVVEAPLATDEQPVVSEPTEPASEATPTSRATPAPETTPTPEATPTPRPRPNPPEPGVGGTGEAVNPPQAAQLIAAQPEAQINLRSQPTTSSSAKGYGLVGDPVQLMRSADRSDGTWYFVKFEESGAEGWIRGDFINTEGRATPLSQRAGASNTCEGLMDGMTVTAFYDANGFHLVRFVNMETQNTFDATLNRQGSSNQGQPLYQGSTSPPTSDRSYPVSLVDLSGGTPRSGSQVNMSYAGIEGSATCE